MLETDQFISRKVELSFLQIYNNEIQDLLTESLQVIKLSHGSLAGQRKVLVADGPQCFNLVKEGNSRRIVRSHKMNDASSRSHCVRALLFFFFSLVIGY